MKFLAAIGVYFAFTVLLAAGMVLAVTQGNFWLLLAGVGLFFALFWRVGCLQH